jgi:glycosyltransferase involved in cell wall biosynthesis
MSTIFESKSNYLGFNLNHEYFASIIKYKKNNINNLKFFCIGGLNSLSRKNINLTIITFFNIFTKNIHLNWELNIYIQGVEIPDIITQYKCDNINYYINDLSYKMIINKYIENDIFIHMGSHEGLGLGFYESLYCGTPVLTMNWTPNNEIINNNINGWLIDCDCGLINDNDNSLINRGIINENDLKNKIIEILVDKDNTLKIINNTIENKNILREKNKNIFEKNLINILEVGNLGSHATPL